MTLRQCGLHSYSQLTVKPKAIQQLLLGGSDDSDDNYHKVHNSGPIVTGAQQQQQPQQQQQVSAASQLEQLYEVHCDQKEIALWLQKWDIERLVERIREKARYAFDRLGFIGPDHAKSIFEYDDASQWKDLGESENYLEQLI